MVANDVIEKVQSALDRLFERDGDLLRHDVNERTITHKLAQYLENEFPGWDVDCEYNRNHNQTKRLMMIAHPPAADNTDGVSVFPDIIVHHRMSDKNFLVIEVKKSTNREQPDFDLAKLQAFIEELGYENALFLLLQTGKQELKAELRWI